jgi:hypothetical protein
VLWWVARVTRAAAWAAVVVLLAGCLGAGDTSGDSPGAPGTRGTGGTGGNGYGGDGGDANGGTGGSGGVGGKGGDGYGGWGGNGYGGDGGDARGGSGFLPGSGRLTSRTVTLSGVSSVVVEAGFVVRLRTGGPEQATIRMDDNLVDQVATTVTGDQLRLGLTPGASVRNATLSAEVTVGQLDRLATGGASRVMLDSTLTSSAPQLVVAGASMVAGPVAVDELQATVSGTATLALSGQVEQLRVSAAGTSRLLLADLAVRRLDVMLSGASRATVAVSDTLAAQTAGASELHYRGAPTITRQRSSGTSSIVRD